MKIGQILPIFKAKMEDVEEVDDLGKLQVVHQEEIHRRQIL